MDLFSYSFTSYSFSLESTERWDIALRGWRGSVLLVCENRKSGVWWESWVHIGTRDLKRPISTAARPPLGERDTARHLPPDSTQPTHPSVTQRHARAHTHTHTLTQILCCFFFNFIFSNSVWAVWVKGASATFISHHQHQNLISLPRSTWQDVGYKRRHAHRERWTAR